MWYYYYSMYNTTHNTNITNISPSCCAFRCFFENTPTFCLVIALVTWIYMLWLLWYISVVRVLFYNNNNNNNNNTNTNTNTNTNNTNTNNKYLCIVFYLQICFMHCIIVYWRACDKWNYKSTFKHDYYYSMPNFMEKRNMKLLCSHEVLLSPMWLQDNTEGYSQNTRTITTWSALRMLRMFVQILPEGKCHTTYTSATWRCKLLVREMPFQGKLFVWHEKTFKSRTQWSMLHM